MCELDMTCEAAELERQKVCRDLAREYGEVIPGNRLWQLLGYRSANAFRQAVHRRRTPVRCFRIAHRRGVFAAPQDVGEWLIKVRQTRLCDAPSDGASSSPAT